MRYFSKWLLVFLCCVQVGMHVTIAMDEADQLFRVAYLTLATIFLIMANRLSSLKGDPQ